ncbi:MAG: sulfite exporter TauE/SafE family protein [Planctomycetota bacterium]
MSFQTTVALLGTGLAVGVLGSLLGVGGGIVLVPVLTLLFGLPVHVAIGTSLVCVIANSIGAGVAAPRERSADVRLALRLEIATVAGALGGGLVAGALRGGTLMIVFGAVMLLTSLYLFKRSGQQRDEHPEAMFAQDYEVKNWPLGTSLSAGAGAISGLLGVGGGFLKVPVMDAIMGIPLGIATATSNYMVGVTAAASVFTYYGRGEVWPAVVVPIAGSVYLGAALGTRLLPKVRAVWLRRALAVVLVLVSFQMVWKGIHHG